jgi:tudor domain-containing protein 1/4/6/7
VVDYGIIEDVSAKNVRLLTPLFFEMPPFAYRCCLKGFENLEVSENINTQFDIFCNDGKGERRVFKMFADEFKPDKGYITELEDESVTPPANVNRILLKNSRPLAETITLENAKKRQKEASNKKESVQVNPIIKEIPKDESAKEPKTPEKNNRNSSQRGRGNHKGTQRSPPIIDSNDKRQRTHFGKQNEQSGTYFKSLKEATSSDKVAKLKPSNSSSSFETNWRKFIEINC